MVPPTHQVTICMKIVYLDCAVLQHRGWFDINLSFCLHQSVHSFVNCTVQIMPRLHHIMDTRQVHKYLDFTISKYLKCRVITTLNRKQLEKTLVQNRFASYEVHIGHLSMLLSVLENRLTLSIFRFKNFFTRLTNWRTDKTSCLTLSRMCVWGNNIFHIVVIKVHTWGDCCN